MSKKKRNHTAAFKGNIMTRLFVGKKLRILKSLLITHDQSMDNLGTASCTQGYPQICSHVTNRQLNMISNNRFLINN